jgi:hypothetical protein
MKRGSASDRDPSIVHRPSQAGPCATVDGRIDVWRIVWASKRVDADPETWIDQVADWLRIPRTYVDVAFDYYREHGGEVDRWLRRAALVENVERELRDIASARANQRR